MSDVCSKSALNQLTVHLADELSGTGSKVNTAHPGWVKTDLGGEGAPMEIVDGAKTSVYVATLPNDGPTGAFIHMQERLPWESAGSARLFRCRALSLAGVQAVVALVDQSIGKLQGLFVGDEDIDPAKAPNVGRNRDRGM